METELGTYFQHRFPDKKIREDLFENGHYWIAIQSDNEHWISIEACSDGKFGASIVSSGLDFGGHDSVFVDKNELIGFVTEKLRINH